jgi:lipooligosaccharide transport system ATP-binding protein
VRPRNPPDVSPRFDNLTWVHARSTPSLDAPGGGVEASEGAVVTARGLTKSFGDLLAVDHIDFDIVRGESFGFLGPNGAGKTSTMRMIACMSPRTSGTLRVLGRDPDTEGPAIRARIGLVPQEDSLDLQLTVLDNLMIYGRYFDLPKQVIKERAQRLLAFAELTDRARDTVEPLSGGMKRRLTIARALVSEPDLLILDEPTTGLDPQARHLLWDRLYRLKLEGVTLVITTHYMDEAEQLCDRLVVMDKGRIAASGTPAALIERYSTREVLELRFVSHQPPGHDVLVGLGDRVEVLPDRVLVYADDAEAALAELNGRGIQPANWLIRRSSLEDVFLMLTGRTLVD